MAAAAVMAEGLIKRYGKITALAGLDLMFPARSLVGFLGPNGAGKTTTFRALLGLVSLSGGTATVLGHDAQTETAAVTHRVGAIVEGPAIYETLSGRDNLRVCALVKGKGAGEIEALLSQVGLTDRASDKAGGYSKGMRQRLALAMALMGDPELLLLDEPMDGLDPAGQVSLREYLRWLVDERSKTVVMSSHILSEVEQLADYVVVIDRGRLVTQGALADLTEQTAGVRVVVDDPARALELLSAASVEAIAEGPSILVHSTDPELISRILAEGAVYPKELRAERPSLESIFLELTDGGTL